MTVAVDPDLCALVADAERLFSAFLRRGLVRGCLRRFDGLVLRDPMRDLSVCREPTKALAPYLGRAGRRFLVVWGHDGSEYETVAPEDVERRVVARLAQAGVDDSDACAGALRPEIEVVFHNVWERVAAIVAKRRGGQPSTAAEVLRRTGVTVATHEQLEAVARALQQQNPKAYLRALLQLAGLRHEPSRFEDLGEQLSLPAVKASETAARSATAWVGWFSQEGHRCGV